jgi:hypothetical protein
VHCGRFIAGLTCLFGGAAGLSACGASTPHEVGPAIVVSCPGAVATSRPTSFNIACGDGSVEAVDLSWTSWGPKSANAAGKVAANNCSGGCAKGTFHDFPARFVLSDLKLFNRSSRYLHLTITYTGNRPYGGSAPWGEESHTYFLGDANGQPWSTGTR